MEIRINIVFLATLGATIASMTFVDPDSLADWNSSETRAVTNLEDALARNRSDLTTARLLANKYLEAGRPQFAVAAIRSVPSHLADDPPLLDLLAAAYEATGQVDDALSTAELALSRCERTLGSASSSVTTPIPAYRCTEREHGMLVLHKNALAYMSQWRVADPRVDSRARLAYLLASRRATVAISP